MSSAESLALTTESIVEGARAKGDTLYDPAVIEYALRLDEVALARLKQAVAGIKGGAGLAERWGRAVSQERKRRVSEAPKSSERKPEKRDRLTIQITPDEEEVNARAVQALALKDIYQRAGALVRVATVKSLRAGETAPRESSEIRPITDAFLRQLLASAARWESCDDNGEWDHAHPPDWSVKAINSPTNGSWEHVRPLYAVTDWPTLLPGGRLLQDAGYDLATGILCRTPFAVDLPDELTQEDARAAAAELLYLIKQFPFEDDPDGRNEWTSPQRSCWVTALLTPIARWAFVGASPLFIFDANKAGIGKGMLVNDMIGGIVLGRAPDWVTATDDEDEERKRMTSKIQAGLSILLIEEIVKPFGSPAMQALITECVWAERLLGTNDAPRRDVAMTLYGAGNAVQFKSPDIRRRTAVMRLVTDLEQPEERKGFDIPDMGAHIREHRARIFRAALVMLRAWYLAERDASTLPGWGGPWGLRGSWDQVVRGAVVFAGLADPIACKASNVEPGAEEGVTDMVIGLEEAARIIDPKEREVSTGDLLTALKGNDEARKQSFGSGLVAQNFPKLRRAIEALLPHLKGTTPNVIALGKLLGKQREKPVRDGDEQRKWIRSRTGSGNVTLWRVEVLRDPADNFDPNEAAGDTSFPTITT